jgi:hypothetical protein
MSRLTPEELDAMIEEAIVDAYGEEEQLVGLFTMIEENLTLPFDTELLGTKVKVVAVEMKGESSIAAVCQRGQQRQRVAIEDLPLPEPQPDGAEWIEAYRRWRGM